MKATIPLVHPLAMTAARVMSVAPSRAMLPLPIWPDGLAPTPATAHPPSAELTMITTNSTATPATTTAIRTFRVEVPQADLDDLAQRIAATRWPTGELVEDRSQGVQLATLRELASY